MSTPRKSHEALTKSPSAQEEKAAARQLVIDNPKALPVQFMDPAASPPPVSSAFQLRKKAANREAQPSH